MSKLKILLVEDHEISRKVALNMLERLGNDVDCVETGGEALIKYKNNHYDIIFVDIGLPDINGLEVIKVIRKYDYEKSKQALLVSLTAHTNLSYEASALEAGFDYFLEKPLSTHKISTIIRQFALHKGIDNNLFTSGKNNSQETMVKTNIS